MNKDTMDLIQRTKKFWKWFSDNEERISELAEHGDHEALYAFVSEGVSIISEDINFGIGKDHVLEFTAEGDDALFLLLPYVTSNAPKKYQKKWKFFPYTQRTDNDNLSLRMYGITISVKDIMVSAKKHNNGSTADLRFYAKAWSSLNETERYNAFYDAMKLYIGEPLTQYRVWDTRYVNKKEKGMFPLTELRGWMLKNLCDDGKEPDPLRTLFSYERVPDGTGLRRDVFAGVFGCRYGIINDYYGEAYESYDQFTAAGAKPAFLYYPVNWHKKGCGDHCGCRHNADEHNNEDHDDDDNEELHPIYKERDDIMDILTKDVLGERGSGKEIGIILGSAMGQYRAYIDLFLYDDKEFVKKARKALADKPYIFVLKEFRHDGNETLLAGIPIRFGRPAP